MVSDVLKTLPGALALTKGAGKNVKTASRHYTAIKLLVMLSDQEPLTGLVVSVTVQSPAGKGRRAYRVCSNPPLTKAPRESVPGVATIKTARHGWERWRRQKKSPQLR